MKNKLESLMKLRTILNRLFGWLVIMLCFTLIAAVWVLTAFWFKLVLTELIVLVLVYILSEATDISISKETKK